MSNEIEAKIAELNYQTALANKDTASKGQTDGVVKYVIGGAITAGIAAWASYQASTYSYNSTLREIELKYAKENREIDLELAKLSLTILAGEYQEDVENSLPARMFALNALERGTGVKIPEDDKTTWAKTGLTPGDITGFRDVTFGNVDSIVDQSLKELMQDVLSKNSRGCVVMNGEEHCGKLYTDSIVGGTACLTSDQNSKLVCGELQRPK
ncbi:hypothetical protein FGK63_20100 [Ruegeria sediminis]|uniref:Uncharacterized protein n=1 Tax=Ruegeria sediminis TaxID=2583820 RepID=A0ABY2WT37_9RHOB|nr:hypothetical protein [Ruegeria sediminis]TMV03311.1 hypothetical protein FGK63_20100 [Ruegeria sediminis]